MPISSLMQSKLDAIHKESAMSEVTCYLDRRFAGRVFAELTVHVRPGYDDALGGIIGASDVWCEDKTGKRFAVNGKLGRVLLRRIKREQPEVWREIEEAAEAEFIEGCIPLHWTSWRRHHVRGNGIQSENPRRHCGGHERD